MMNSEGPPANPFQSGGDPSVSGGGGGGAPQFATAPGGPGAPMPEDNIATSFHSAHSAGSGGGYGGSSSGMVGSGVAESQFVGAGPMDAPAPAAPEPLQQQQQPPKQSRAAGYQQPQMSATPSIPNTPQGCLGAVQSCLSLDTYRMYFDVDTADIVRRIVASVKMCNVPDGFRNDVMMGGGSKGPDLYGPFWITATMVFCLAVTSNMHKYLKTDDVSEFEADINHLVHAMPVLYAFTFLIPAAFFLVLRCVAIPFPLMELICLYGYALVPYAPTTLLCLIPVNALEWIFLLAATCVSCLFVLRNVATPILSSDLSHSKAPGLVVFVVACHTIFFLVLKFAFFHHQFSSSSSGSGGGGGDSSSGGGGDYPAPAPAPTAGAADGGSGEDGPDADEGDGGDRYFW